MKALITMAVPGKRSLSLLKQVRLHLNQSRKLSQTPKNSSKLYELRTYTLKPAHFKEYLQLTSDKFHLRTTHSKLCGFWITELGGLNEVIHIWEYDSLTHRAGVRQKLASDEVWTETYFKPIAPFLVKQDNAILMPSSLKPLEDSPIKEGGAYELCIHQAKPGSEGLLMQAVLNKAKLVGDSGSGKLMGLFSTDVGQNNTVYHLWNYESMDKRLDINDALGESSTGELYNHATSMSNKLMNPFVVSPLN